MSSRIFALYLVATWTADHCSSHGPYIRLSTGLLFYQWLSKVSAHDDVIKWKYFPRYWSFARGIYRSAVNSLHKGQWRGALLFSLIGAWINGWVNNDKNGDLRRPLLWRHNGRDSVSNPQPHEFLLNRLFRRWSKKTSKLYRTLRKEPYVKLRIIVQ